MKQAFTFLFLLSAAFAQAQQLRVIDPADVVRGEFTEAGVKYGWRWKRNGEVCFMRYGRNRDGHRIGTYMTFREISDKWKYVDWSKADFPIRWLCEPTTNPRIRAKGWGVQWTPISNPRHGPVRAGMGIEPR